MHAAPFGIFHVNLHARRVRRLHCSKFSPGSATFTKQVDFKVELIPWLREIAKFSSTS